MRGADEVESPPRGFMELSEKSIRSETAEFQLRSDGVVHGVVFPDRPQSLDDAKKNVEVLSELSAGSAAPLLLDIRNTGTLSREAREYYAGEDGARVITGLAFLADSAFTRVVGNLFIRLAKTRYPVRLFTEESAALRWLRGLRP